MASTSQSYDLFQLPASSQDIVAMVRRFAEERVAPAAQAIDTGGEFPSELYRQCHELGLIGLLVPEELGGAGESLVTMALIYEALAKASATCSLVLSNSIEVAELLARHASGSIRERYLDAILTDGKIPCFALTEPGAGSDAGGITTRAQLRRNRYVLNGRKIFITNGAVADFFVVFAVTDPDARQSQRLTAFMVERDAAGFSVGTSEATMGVRGSPLTELALDNVEVSEDRVLGGVGQGLPIALGGLIDARIGAAAQCVGICADALDRSLAYANDRVQFGQKIIEFQAMQLMIADMAIRTEASRQLTLAAAVAQDRGSPEASSLSAMCKTLASDSAMQNALDAIQVHGGYGYCRDFGVERLARDAKAYQIFDGTNQIQRLNLAKGLARRKRR